MKFEIYREPSGLETTTVDSKDRTFVFGMAAGNWRWRMRASNGRIVAEGGEGYEHAPAMVRTMERYVALTVGHRRQLSLALNKHGLTSTGRIAASKKAHK